MVAVVVADLRLSLLAYVTCDTRRTYHSSLQIACDSLVAAVPNCRPDHYVRTYCSNLEVRTNALQTPYPAMYSAAVLLYADGVPDVLYDNDNCK
jgi:hypothetical protein